MQKFTTKYLVLCLVLVIVFIGIVREKTLKSPNIISPSPTSSPVIQYLTYTNNRYGYSFTYPSTVTVVENIGEFGHFDADPQSKLVLLLNNNSSSPSQSFGIEEVDLPPGQTLLSYVKKINYYSSGYLENSGEPYDIRPRQKVLTLEEFSLDGKPAIKIISQVLPDQGSVIDTNFQVWVQVGPNQALQLSDPMAQYHPLEFDENLVSSFRFFAPSPEPAWRKHNFPKLGISLSLPPSWVISSSNLDSYPEFSLSHESSIIRGSFGPDGTLGQKTYLADWNQRPDPRASYHLFSYDYSQPDQYAVLASIKTPNQFLMEAFIPMPLPRSGRAPRVFSRG